MNRLKCFLVGGLVCVAGLPSLLAGDWPAYKHDVQRSSVTDETLTLPLRQAWKYIPAQPPRPAWSEAIRPPYQMDFDYAPHPVIAGGMVFFGSSADDTVRALDERTGVEKWRFITGGPIRFAPQIEKGKVYVASDDGFVYCLEFATGKPLWTFRAAPEDERLIGNRRMISRWPIRTGILVDNGTVYCVAGIWPAEGVYVYALEADTGKVVWCNDKGGYLYKSIGETWRAGDPHAGEFTMFGLTPQGALLANQHTLLVPLGYNMPASFVRATGNMYRFTPASSGSTWVTIDQAEDIYYNLQKGKGAGDLTLFGRSVGKKDEPGRVRKVASEQIPQLTLATPRSDREIQAMGKVSFVVHKGRVYSRHAYGLALAGGILLAGEEDSISAVDPDSGRALWRGAVNGKAHEIAVANGKLFVATSCGEISCFVPSGATPSPDGTVLDSAAALRKTPTAPPDGVAAAVIEQVKQAHMDQGFALVLGDPDGKLSISLASQTTLHVVNVLTDETAVRSLRERLLTETALYGSRIEVQSIAGFDRLPFARYFANVVVATGTAANLSGKELYRVLRPCGGILLFPEIGSAQAQALIQDSGAPAVEARTAGGSVSLVRGRLPGSRDWDSGKAQDKLVKWPLRPIWFGGPDSALVMNSQIALHSPVAANGRYYVMGDDTLSAVDAYNGNVLWTRPVPTAWPNFRRRDGLRYSISNSPAIRYPQQLTVFKRIIGADDKNVYLTLGKGYFRDTSDACIQLDAQDGRQKAMYAPFTAPQRISLQTAQTWPLAVSTNHTGSVTLEKTSEGISLTLSTKDPLVTPLDTWDLFFDFRPTESRYGLYDRGVFHSIVVPALDEKTPARCLANEGSEIPKFDVVGKRTTEGATTTVRLSWAEIERLAGGRPSSFGFAVTLNAHDGGKQEALTQRHLFADATADRLNAGWADVLIDEAQAAPAKAPSIVLGSLDSMPKGWAATGAWNPEGIEESAGLAPRLHPLTGEPGPKVFRSGTGGCGRPAFAASSVFGRSAKNSLGIYDFEDDSGLRFFPGIPVSCSVNEILKSLNINAALGMLIFSEARNHCDCMIPIRASVGFATADRRLNEDWAIFFDRDPDTQIRQVAINFAAFGDRRDDEGRLWLSFPRPEGGTAFPLAPGTRRALVQAPPMSATLQVPLKVEGDPGRPGQYAVNSDRVKIQKTRSPWIYTSGYRGIRKATLQLNPLKPVVSLACEKPPVLDGKLDKEEWTPQPQTSLPYTKTEVFVRHDANNLYLAAKRPAVINRTGKITPWRKTARGEDADVFGDDSLEIFLSDAARSQVVHLAVSASGARFDARAAATGGEDRSWNAAWTSAVVADDSGFAAELVIPWQTLTAAGLAKDALGLNVQMNQKDVSNQVPDYPGAEKRDPSTPDQICEPLAHLGSAGRQRCENFAPLGLGTALSVKPQLFTVRLHFAELEDVKPGQRVFDVKLQDQVVLKDFDIVKEAGGIQTALVKEFKHIPASDQLTLEFIQPPKNPKARPPPPETWPILSGLEVYDEDGTTPVRRK